MVLPLSTIAVAEKNKLFTDALWLLAIKIIVPGLTDPIRIVKNNNNITWQEETWVAFPFELDDMSEESKGEVPQVELRVSNIGRELEMYIHQYDLYCKQNGYAPIEVYIYVLLSKDLASGIPVSEHVYELKQPKTNAQWATFVLGASSPFAQRYPQSRLLKNFCRVRYNYPAGSSLLCGATSDYTTCNHTLSDCRARDNSTRFGGFPGVGLGGIRIS